jgi:hypothetical protein
VKKSARLYEAAALLKRLEPSAFASIAAVLLAADEARLQEQFIMHTTEMPPRERVFARFI